MKMNLVLLTLTIVATNLLVPKEINFLFILVLVFFITPYDNAIFYKRAFSTLLPILLILILGIIAGATHMGKDYIRDVFIVSKNIVYFLGGIMLSKYVKNVEALFIYFAIFTAFYSVRHIGLFALHYHSVNSLDQFRKDFGLGNMNEVIFLSIVVAGRFNMNSTMLMPKLKVYYKMMIFMVVISFALYLSRSMIISFVILTLFLTSVINIRKFGSKTNRRIFRLVITSLLVIMLGSLFASIFPSNQLLNSLVQKFERIPEEISWNSDKNSTASLQEINENWRGYEAYQGLLKFNDGTSLQKTFGYGFGALVDLGLVMRLGGQDYEKVPFLHNGYVTLLVKCGILGVLLYLYFLLKIGFSKVRTDEDPEICYSYQMLSGLSIITLLSTFTTTGLLNPTNAVIPILLGFFWANIQRYKINGPLLQETIKRKHAMHP